LFEKPDHSMGVIKEQNVSSDVFEQYNLCVPFFVGKCVRETSCTPSPTTTVVILVLGGRIIKAKINRGLKVPYYRKRYRVWKGIKKLR